MQNLYIFTVNIMVIYFLREYKEPYKFFNCVSIYAPVCISYFLYKKLTLFFINMTIKYC